jgi:hypothetical protein
MTGPDQNGVYWCESGKDETGIDILDSDLFTSSPWLREKQFSGSFARIRKRYAGLKFAAVSSRERGSRHRGRMWYLRAADDFSLACPVEAVIPGTIAANSVSVPFFSSKGAQ